MPPVKQAELPSIAVSAAPISPPVQLSATAMVTPLALAALSVSAESLKISAKVILDIGQYHSRRGLRCNAFAASCKAKLLGCCGFQANAGQRQADDFSNTRAHFGAVRL